MSGAFFHAGANGVLATLRDVAEAPTERIIPHYSTQSARVLPTRAAQLDLLSALRQGRVRVETPLGSLVLPEHPVFWAGFILLDRSL